MVVPVRELANKHFSSTYINSKDSNMTKLLSRIDIDVNDTNRERFTSLSTMTSRSVSIVSNISSCMYHLKMEHNNNLPDDIAVDLIDSSQLLYSGDVEVEGNLINKKVSDLTSTKEL